MDVSDWIFQAVLSMMVAALGFLYFLKVVVVPPGESVFNIGDVSVADQAEYILPD